MPDEVFADIIDLIQTAPEQDQAAIDAVWQRDAHLTKPSGSLGKLEHLVAWLAGWQRTAQPHMEAPMMAIFAGNHGVVVEGVSAFPAEVTAQMVANFANNGAAISQICKANEINLRVFELALEMPTGNICSEPAMQDKVCAATMAYGMESIEGAPDVLGIGEMGIGNTTPAAAIFAALFGGTGQDWVGRGTGVDDEMLKHKADIVDRALEHHKQAIGDPLQILARLGGREIAAMAGAIIAARHHKIPVMVDGFVATAAAAVLYAVHPASLDHCQFAHLSDEQGHRLALETMAKTPLLDLGMRLGEGSGAGVALGIVRTALAVHRDMATFEQAAVSVKSTV